MSYYITIYIYPINLNIPHTFLGFTKGKSPDELDKQDDEIRQEKLKMLIGGFLNKSFI